MDDLNLGGQAQLERFSQDREGTNCEKTVKAQVKVRQGIITEIE